jgi:hypothetical protein
VPPPSQNESIVTSESHRGVLENRVEMEGHRVQLNEQGIPRERENRMLALWYGFLHCQPRAERTHAYHRTATFRIRASAGERSRSLPGCRSRASKT